MVLDASKKLNMFKGDARMAESIIRQKNRTLLIEEINPEKLNLLTLVGDVRGLDSLSDDKVK